MEDESIFVHLDLLVHPVAFQIGKFVIVKPNFTHMRV